GLLRARRSFGPRRPGACFPRTPGRRAALGAPGAPGRTRTRRGLVPARRHGGGLHLVVVAGFGDPGAAFGATTSDLRVGGIVVGVARDDGGVVVVLVIAALG